MRLEQRLDIALLQILERLETDLWRALLDEACDRPGQTVLDAALEVAAVVELRLVHQEQRRKRLRQLVDIDLDLSEVPGRGLFVLEVHGITLVEPR